MKNLNFNKIFNLRFILVLLFSLACAILSVYLMINDEDSLFKIITFICSFIFSFYYLYKNYKNILRLFEKNKALVLISLIISIIIMWQLVINSKNLNVINRVFGIKLFYPFSYLGIFVVISLFSIKIKDWLNKFIKQMDQFEKRGYIITSFLVLIVLIFMYTNKVNFYQDYNVVYSIDSGLVYGKYLSNPHYYDIRHPLTSILTFPIYSIVNFLCMDSIMPIIIQFINVQLLILIGLELKRLTKNKWVYIFYILSFSSLIYILFVEKFILSVFLMVTYIYNIFINKDDNDNLLIFAIGTLPTNVYISVIEFFKKGKFFHKIFNLTKIFFIGLLIIIITGRLPMVKTAYEDLLINSFNYRASSYTLMNKFNATTKMIETSFVAIPASEHSLVSLTGKPYNAWVWDDVTESVSIVGGLVILISLFGIIDIIRKKNKKYYSFILSFIFAFVLFMLIGWDIHESPLFSICFSFAIIPLFIYSLEKIFKMFKIKVTHYKYIYSFLLLAMMVVNVFEIINIYKYIK